MIGRSEIVRITEYPGQGLLIRGISRSLQIFVPSKLEGFSGLREQLEQWHSIEVRSTNSLLNALLPSLAGFGSVAACATVMLAQNQFVAISVGTVYLIVLCLAIASVQRSSLLDRKMKAQIWWALVPMLAIGLRVFLAIVNG